MAVLNSSGGLVETIPSGASILTNAGPLEVVNFVLSGAANQPLSEFDQILADLKPLLGTRNLADLTEDRHEISLLASQSRYSPEQVAALVLAHKRERETTTPITTTPAQVFYGWLREGLPANVDALHATDPVVRFNALEAAVEQGVIPKEIGGKKIEAFLSNFAPAPPAGLQRLVGSLLNANELDTFVGRFLGTVKTRKPSAEVLSGPSPWSAARRN